MFILVPGVQKNDFYDFSGIFYEKMGRKSGNLEWKDLAIASETVWPAGLLADQLTSQPVDWLAGLPADPLNSRQVDRTASETADRFTCWLVNWPAD